MNELAKIAKLFEIFNSDATPATPKDFIAEVDAAGTRLNYTDAQLALIYAAFDVAFDELVGNDPIAIDHKRNEETPTKFRQLRVGQTFDFVSGNTTFDSFFDACVKISKRRYRSLTSDREYHIGNGRSHVYHVDEF